MKTIKIARISGEFFNKVSDDVCEYLNPYLGFPTNTWHTFKKGKKLFDSIDFNKLLKEDKDILEEYKTTEEQMEFKILDYNRDGYKPIVFLFTFEIPEYIWKNKNKFAEENEYDDVNDYITEYTNYKWDLEIEREVEIPKELIEFFENFTWIEGNLDKLQLLYMQYLIETGGDENVTQESFNMFMAKEGRDIIEKT